MKRKLSMTLAIILVATSFAGCDEETMANELLEQYNNNEQIQDFVQEQVKEIIQEDLNINQELELIVEDTPEELPEETKTTEIDETTNITENSSEEVAEVTEVSKKVDTTNNQIIPNTFELLPQDELDKGESSSTQIIPTSLGLLPQEELDKIEAEKNDPNNYLSYKGNSVMELFAYDVNNYSMANFNVLATNTTNNDIIGALNDYTSKTPDSYAYFIKTYNFETKETEKHYIYLDNSNEMLLTQCENKIKDSTNYASWTNHMSEENVVSVRISQSSPTNGGTVDITDTKTAQQIANALKGNLTIESFTSVSDGKNWIIPNSNSDYTLVYITFNNGVEYHIQLLNGSLQIYTTDLDKTLTYKMYTTPYDTINDILSMFLS